MSGGSSLNDTDFSNETDLSVARDGKREKPWISREHPHKSQIEGQKHEQKHDLHY
jgi:hypothetical protein